MLCPRLQIGAKVHCIDKHRLKVRVMTLEEEQEVICNCPTGNFPLDSCRVIAIREWLRCQAMSGQRPTGEAQLGLVKNFVSDRHLM